MPPRREFVFICTVCEPMHAQDVTSTAALQNYAQQHVHRHSLGTSHSRSRVVCIVSSPKEESDTPELYGLLRWEAHERAQRSEKHLPEAGTESPEG